MYNYTVYDSPIGPIYIMANETGIIHVILDDEEWNQIRNKYRDVHRGGALCHQAEKELNEYFLGQRKEFSLPFAIEGTEFRKQVWRALCSIPYGETRNYLDIARMVDNPKGVRAVGQANKANPLAILIPCHRVIGKNGGLTGYMGKKGLEKKKFLLDLEQRFK